MRFPYGYIRRTVGADGDQVDVILGPNRDSQFVVIANQHDAIGGQFEEHKTLLGFNSLAAARAAYRSMYVGRFVPRPVFKTTSVQRLKEWLSSGMTWGAFRFEDRRGLTVFDRVMNKPKDEEKRSHLGRTLAILGGGAVAATAGYRWLRGYDKARGAALHSYNLRTNPEYAQKHLEKLAAEKTAQDTKRSIAREALKVEVERQKRLSAKARLVEFRQGRHADDGTFMVGVDPLSHYRRASRVVPWINRAGQTAGDLGDMAVGKKVKEPFYKKSWFKRAVQTAAVAAPSMALALGVHRRSAIMHGDVPLGESKTDGRIARAAGKVGRVVDEKILDKLSGLRRYAAKVKATELIAKGYQRLVELDYASDLKGWDLRDPRGKSARVFAPGSGKRQRREKTPSERIDRIRLIKNLALAGTAAGIGGTLYYRGQMKKLAPKVAVPANLIRVTPEELKKSMAARVRTTEFRRKETPALHRVIDATRNNTSAPSRPEIPGEGTARMILENPRARRGVFRVLGAGSLAGGGVLAGILARKPKTGAALGGLGAGWVLRG